MNKNIIKILNSLGLSCIFGGVFLNIYIFSNILLFGRITLLEPRYYILIPELIMSIIGIIYFIQLYRLFLKEFGKPGVK